MPAVDGVLRTIMRAIRVSQFGGPEVMKLEYNVTIPKPSKSQVLIKVRAAGVNPVDTYIRAGTYALKPDLPYTPGHDVAGTVEDVGSEVKAFKKGDRVFTFRTASGGYAEYCTAEAETTKLLKGDLTLDQGAGIGVPYYTAYRAVQIVGNAKPGETILVHGATGSVGLACIQYAHHIGMKVLGTGGTKAGLDLIENNGADALFYHREEGYTKSIMDVTDGKGPDLIIEMLANVNLEKDLNMVARKGRIVVVGNRGSIEITPRHMMAKECMITGMLMGGADAEEWGQMHSAIEAGMKPGGWVRPHIARTYSLDQAQQVHEDIINSTGAVGRLIIKNS